MRTFRTSCCCVLSCLWPARLPFPPRRRRARANRRTRRRRQIQAVRHRRPALHRRGLHLQPGGRRAPDSRRGGAGRARRQGGLSQGVRLSQPGAAARDDDAGHHLRHGVAHQVHGDGGGGHAAGAVRAGAAERSGGALHSRSSAPKGSRTSRCGSCSRTIPGCPTISI